MTDRYGRQVPKAAHGTEGFGMYTSSTKIIMAAALRVFERVVDPQLLAQNADILAQTLIRVMKAE